MTSEDNPTRSVARLVPGGLTITHQTAVKIGKIEGPLAERYADLIIHRADLQFARGCAQVLAQSPPDSTIIRDALFQSAIVAWAKCFVSSYAGRFRLQIEVLYGEGLPRDTATYFMTMRHKSIAHNENPFSQALPIALINPPGTFPKVAEVSVIGLTANVDTTGYGLTNVIQLVEDASRWVDEEKERVTNLLLEELEALDYGTLMALPEPEIATPDAADVGTTRQR